jgi:DNA/RNA endonuclease YhcR with UshA esterase domain
LISRKLQTYVVVLLASSFSLIALTAQGFAQSSEWVTPSAPVVSWTDAGNRVGQYVAVQGTIVRTFYYFPQYYYDGAYFLVLGTLYQGYFYGVILSSDSVNFKCSITQFYLNKDVRITGTIQLYNGAPEIIVSSPSQIEVAYMGYPCS